MTMWEKMQEFDKTNPRTFSADNSDHMTRMMEERYVYLTDKTTAYLSMADNCELSLVDDQVGIGMPLYYSMGMRKNSAYTAIFGDA